MQSALIIAALTGVAVLLFYIVVAWKIFSKAGRPGWAIFIPIYNLIVQLQVAKMSPWLVFLYLLGIIPVVGQIFLVVFSIIITVKTGTAFGKGTGFILGMIFLPFIFNPILAFGSSRYQFDDEEEEMIELEVTNA
ncbi:MAG: hypothetical protein J6C77_00060 [Muribaculaceae bacterium]|nr:hypothetical protein [Muribaculaceae bacterium]